MEIKQKKRSDLPDGFVEKFVFELDDGEKVEGVYRQQNDRAEVYLSSEVGCGVGCRFCACTEEWLIRDLKSKEIVEQAELMLEGKKYFKLRISFNGIGEPTMNEKAVTKAIKKIAKVYPQATIKVTTTGANAKYIRKWESLPIELQLSLHAPTAELREQIIETVMDPKKIIRTARHFAKVKNHHRRGRGPASGREKVTVNYLLLKDFNDTFPVIDELLKLVDPKYFRIMLSHLNEVEVENFPYEESTKFDQVKEYVASKGFEVTEYTDAGRIANAGCGQLTSS